MILALGISPNSTTISLHAKACCFIIANDSSFSKRRDQHFEQLSDSLRGRNWIETMFRRTEPQSLSTLSLYIYTLIWRFIVLDSLQLY